MLASIIMDNIIVDKEFVEDNFEEIEEAYPHNPFSAFIMCDGPIDRNDNRFPHDLVQRTQQSQVFSEHLATL